MSKSVVVLLVALLGCTVAAVSLRRDLQHERARADALAERLSELEPLERREFSYPKNGALEHRTDVHTSAQKPIEPPLTSAPASAPRLTEYQGTLRTRQQVERLQAALENGTALQSYQIQPLITAIDKVRREIEREQSSSAQSGTRHVEWDTEADRRIVHAAADVLFESQLETFAQLLDDDAENAKKN